MPLTDVKFYLEDGKIPLLEWLDKLPLKARLKCRRLIERLEELGHELRRPEADILRDGIYELRVRLQGVNYRILNFFHGKQVVVISHGLVKERIVPPKEIDLAIKRKKNIEADFDKYIYSEGEENG